MTHPTHQYAEHIEALQAQGKPVLADLAKVRELQLAHDEIVAAQRDETNAKPVPANA